MQLPIPEEIRRALAGGAHGRVELYDPHTQTRYVLVPAEEYAQQLDDFALSWSQGSQHFGDPLAQQVVIDRLAGAGGVRVPQEIFQGAFAVVSQSVRARCPIGVSR